MKISSDHIAAAQSLGYTPDEARFLYIAATHSGYFVPRQFVTFTGAKSTNWSSHFTQKLESRGHATWREHLRLGGVYHLVSKTLYRVIDKESLRNWGCHSTDLIRTRLLLLDFILANLHYEYFETEQEKISYFCERLGVPKKALPARAFAGSHRTEPAIRYFVDKFPLYLDAPDASPASPVTFSYVDSGEASRAGLARYLHTYEQLFSHLSHFHILYICNSPVHFPAAERCFCSFAKRVLRQGWSEELLRYFRLQAAWERKQYGNLSNEDIEWLDQASGRFEGPDTERLYAAWCAGQLTDDTLEKHLANAHGPDNFRFSTYLVSTGHATSKELQKAG
jgi:hypothetical protein